MSEIKKPGTLWGMMGGLREWIDETGVAITDRTVKETHMSFVGGPYGRLKIPHDLHETWLRKYADEVSRNQHSVFFCERRTKIFRMHFDLDFVQDSVVHSSVVQDMIRMATDVFRDFFPNIPPTANEWISAVMRTPPKSTKRNDGTDGIVKSGFHVIWPYLFVDKAMALQMRLNFVLKLEKKWPARTGDSNSYDDVVDVVVLTSNGLRMYGSDKASRCKACKSAKTSDACKICQGRGVIVENRSYTLDSIIAPDGKLDMTRFTEWLDNMHTCIRFTTTRVSHPLPTAGFQVPGYAATNATIKYALKGEKRKGGGGGGGENGPRGSELVDASLAIHTYLRDLIATGMGTTQWKDIELTRVFLLRAKGEYLCHVAGMGSSYCRNVGRAHTSSTIYFVVTPRGVSQGCFSPKSSSCGPCKRYHHSPQPVTPLTMWLRAALFGYTKASKVAEALPPVPKVTCGTDDDFHVPMNKTVATTPTPRVRPAVKASGPPTQGMMHPSQSMPHPDYPGMTRGEVAAIPASQLKNKKIECMRRLPDAEEIYRKIIGEGEAVVANPPKRRKK